MKNAFFEILTNLLQFSFCYFIAWLFLKFTPLKNVNSELIKTISLGSLLLLIGVLLLAHLRSIKGIENLTKKGKLLRWNFVNKLNSLFGVINRFDSEERGSEEYKMEIERQIKKSKRIYFRLYTGHTMYFDDRERFIMKALKNLSPQELKEKDIRIQLMDRSAAAFDERARKFVEALGKRDPTRKISLSEHLQRTKDIEADLVKLLGPDKIRFYQRKYLWRLHIFDDVIFLSSYNDEPTFIEGHLTASYSFTKKHNATLFNSHLAEFNSLYKKTLPPKA